MASLDSQGEIVPVELANPEETQIGKGENEPVCSFILPPSFDKHSGWYGNGLIEVEEKFEFGVFSMRGSLFLTYQGRSKETLFAGYPEQKRMTVRPSPYFCDYTNTATCYNCLSWRGPGRQSCEIMGSKNWHTTSVSEKKGKRTSKKKFSNMNEASLSYILLYVL